MNGFSWVVCNINCSLLCKAFPQLKSSIFFSFFLLLQFEIYFPFLEWWCCYKILFSLPFYVVTFNISRRLFSRWQFFISLKYKYKKNGLKILIIHWYNFTLIILCKYMHVLPWLCILLCFSGTLLQLPYMGCTLRTRVELVFGIFCRH